MATYAQQHAPRTMGGMDGNLGPTGLDFYRTNLQVKFIANKINGIINRKLEVPEAQGLIDFIKAYRSTDVLQVPVAEAHNIFAGKYINFLRAQQATASQTQLTPELEQRAGLEPGASLHEYMVKEVGNMSSAENPLKQGLHGDRRGTGILSPPNVGVMSGASAAHASPSEMNDAMYRMALNLNTTLAPDNLFNMMRKISGYSTTLDNIALPWRYLSLDSRNRAINGSYGEKIANGFRWDLNVTGSAGGQGTVRSFDDISQVCRYSMESFWLPKIASDVNQYHKIRIVIREFDQLAYIADNVVSESASAVDTQRYQLEFNAVADDGKRIQYAPPAGCDQFICGKPVAVVNSITLLFLTPDGPLTFDPDRYNVVITHANPTLFTIVPITGVAPVFNTGDQFMVLASASGSRTVDAALTRRNPPFMLTKTGALAFTIPFDSSAAVVGTQSSSVFLVNKSLSINLRLQVLEH